MTDTPYNPDDPAFLASRSLDEELSAAERQRLDDAMAASQSLRGEAEGLRAIDGLVKKWGQAEVEPDWAAYAKLIEAKAFAEPDVERDHKLDELLEGWADDRAVIDEKAFTAAVMVKVQAQSRRVWPRGLIFRLGTPLAAAAAVALVVTATLMYRSSPAPHVEVLIRSRLSAIESPSETTRVAIVSFRREPVPGYAPETTSPGISFMVVGASPLAQDLSNEAPPI